jgi:hypothetical protein
VPATPIALACGVRCRCGCLAPPPKPSVRLDASQQLRRPTGTTRRIGAARPSIQSSIGMQARRCRIATANGKNVVRPTVPRYDQARTLSKHAVKRTADAHPARCWNAARVVASGASASTTRERAGGSTGAFATKGQSGLRNALTAVLPRMDPMARGPIRTSVLVMRILIGAPASPRERQFLSSPTGRSSADASEAPSIAYEANARNSVASPAIRGDQSCASSQA